VPLLNVVAVAEAVDEIVARVQVQEIPERVAVTDQMQNV